MSGERLAAAALTMIGTRFRLHGRVPEIGLDCIGLLEAAMGAIGRPCRLPNGYTLRQRQTPPLTDFAAAAGFEPVGPEDIRMGDVTVFRTGPCQSHLAIATHAHRIVHAHAGLQRVVESPVPEGWASLARFRLIVVDHEAN